MWQALRGGRKIEAQEKAAWPGSCRLRPGPVQECFLRSSPGYCNALCNLKIWAWGLFVKAVATMPKSRWARDRRSAPSHSPPCTLASVGQGERPGLRGRGWRFAQRATPTLRPDGGGERVPQAALEMQLSGEGSPPLRRSRLRRVVA